MFYKPKTRKIYPYFLDKEALKCTIVRLSAKNFRDKQ